MLKATYESNYRQVKEGNGKGKLFHRYDVTGTQAELDEYTKSAQFVAHPRHNEKTGGPQFVTMYIDLMSDSLPLYKKRDGNYTLDSTETNKQVAKLEAAAALGSKVENAFANALVAKIMGGQVDKKVTNAVFADEATTDDFNDVL
jgi:hypothetical protein